MSEGHQIFTNINGRQIMVDTNAGKYYTIVDSEQNIGYINQQDYPSNGRNETSQARKNNSSMKSTNPQTKKGQQQKAVNVQQFQQNRSTTRQSDTLHNSPSPRPP